MLSIKLFTKTLFYGIFIGVIFTGTMGLYEVTQKFGDGTVGIIVPSMFIVLIGIFGMISTYNTK